MGSAGIPGRPDLWAGANADGDSSDLARGRLAVDDRPRDGRLPENVLLSPAIDRSQTHDLQL